MARYSQEDLEAMRKWYSSFPRENEPSLIVKLIQELQEANHKVLNLEQIEKLRVEHDNRQSRTNEFKTHTSCPWKHCPHPSQCADHCSIRVGED